MSLTSVVSYPERGEGGSNRYRGNCSPRLIEDLINFFRPSQICDYMCGSGTTKSAADRCGINMSGSIFTKRKDLYRMWCNTVKVSD